MVDTKTPPFDSHLLDLVREGVPTAAVRAVLPMRRRTCGWVREAMGWPARIMKPVN